MEEQEQFATKYGWSSAHGYAQAVLRVAVGAFVLSQDGTPDDADDLWRIIGGQNYPETAGDAARMLSDAWAQVRAEGEPHEH